MSQYFGEPWDAPEVRAAEQVPTPVGRVCIDCRELVVDGDRGWMRAVMWVAPGAGEPAGSVEPIHAECELRGILGHQVGVCHCTGYEAGRVAAREVWRRVGALRGRLLEHRAGEAGAP